MRSPLINQTNSALEDMPVGLGHPANSAIEQLQRRGGSFIFSIKVRNEGAIPRTSGSLRPTQLKLIHQKLIITNTLEQLGRVLEKNRIGINEYGFTGKRDSCLDRTSLTSMIITTCSLPGIQCFSTQRQYGDRPAIKCLWLVSHQRDRKISRILSTAQRRQNTELRFMPINSLVAIQ